MGERKRTVILGLGNTALTDDGVGVYAARRARELVGSGEEIEVKEAEIAGFALLDLLDGFERAVIIDALNRPGRAPGEASLHTIESFDPTSHLISGHQIDLPTAIALGHELGQSPPSEVYIVGIQVADDRTLAERCTPAVERAIDPAAKLALEVARARDLTPSTTCVRSP
jgi:hydrogenase maturation protease